MMTCRLVPPPLVKQRSLNSRALAAAAAAPLLLYLHFPRLPPSSGIHCAGHVVLQSSATAGVGASRSESPRKPGDPDVHRVQRSVSAPRPGHVRRISYHAGNRRAQRLLNRRHIRLDKAAAGCQESEKEGPDEVINRYYDGRRRWAHAERSPVDSLLSVWASLAWLLLVRAAAAARSIAPVLAHAPPHRRAWVPPCFRAAAAAGGLLPLSHAVTPRRALLRRLLVAISSAAPQVFDPRGQPGQRGRADRGAVRSDQPGRVLR